MFDFLSFVSRIESLGGGITKTLEKRAQTKIIRSEKLKYFRQKLSVACSKPKNLHFHLANLQPVNIKTEISQQSINYACLSVAIA